MEILTHIPVRPVTVGIIASPAKLGSASVILLGKDALVKRAEADRLSAYNRETGSIGGVRVDSWTAVDAYALDRSNGFHGLTVDSIDPRTYLVSVPKSSSIVLYPCANSETQRRDLVLHPGDSSSEGGYTDIIRATQAGLAKSIEVKVHDTAAVLLVFDTSRQFRRIH